MRAVHPVAVRLSSYSPQALLPRWKRRLALAFAALFTWSAGFALPLQALAQASAHERTPQPRPALPRPHDDPSWHTFDYHAPHAAPLLRFPHPAFQTLLDEQGRLTRLVAARQVRQWQRALATHRLTPRRAAWERLWLGEYRLAHDQQPDAAIAEFTRAQQLGRPADHGDDLPTSASTTFTGLTAAQGVDYGYYPDGSLQTLTTPAGSYNYSYNKRGDLTGLTDPFAGSFAWSYLDNGWLNTQQVGHAATTTDTLNALGQIVDQATHQFSTGTLLSDFSSQGSGHYDGAGDLLGLTASLPAVSSYSGTVSYGYDTVSQLNQVSSTRTGGYSESFAYDAAGNPTTFRGAGEGYNSDNQNSALTFDGDGNPTSWSGQTLTFDANSDLSALGSTLSAGYNAEGQRAWKQTSAGKTYFLYAGGSPVCELDSNGNVLAANTWGGNGLLSRHTTSSNSSVFYTWDRQGGCAQRLDSSGNVLGSDAFDGYGNRQSTDNSADPYSGYGGQWGYYRDAETGLSLLGARYYDPGQGRFLNRDPSGYAGGFNLYAYAANNPLNWTDAEGLIQVPELTACVAKAAFPKGNPYLTLRDHLGVLFQDELFAPLYPRRGQPAQAPGRLALVTIMPFAEDLSDPQAAEAVRSRMDCK